MRGIIIGISNRNDFVALQTEFGDCFVKNISEGETSEVYFQYHGLKDINEVKRILNS